MTKGQLSARVDLVVTDLDGTLWQDERELHPRTRAAVDELARRGVPLLVATGRRVGSAQRALAPFGMAPPAVLLNGSLGVDLDTGERFHRGGFGTDAALRVLEAFERHGVDPCLYVEGVSPSVYVSVAPSTHPDHLASFGDGVQAVHLRTVAESEHILAFGVLGIDGEVGGAIAESLAAIAAPHFDVDRMFGGHALTVAPAGDSKWDGVVAFCDRHGLDSPTVLAIGDGPNDVEMLQAAAVAVVPSDGHPDALAIADHVVEPAAAGGWASLLDFL